MNYLFRVDRGTARLSFGEAIGTVTDRAKRRWKVREGDLLLFIQGHSLETTFFAIGIVIEVMESTERLDAQEQQFYRYELKLREVRRITEEVLLEEVMYSLGKIANFTQPFLHLRHRGLIDDTDLEVIRLNRIATVRSLYYGILRELEPPWRERLELRARLLRLSRIQSPGQVEFDATVPPLAELYDVLAETIVLPLRLGRRVGAAWGSIVPEIREVEVLSAPDVPNWQMLSFCDRAASVGIGVETEWRGLHAHAYEARPSPEERERKWRPHHW